MASQHGTKTISLHLLKAKLQRFVVLVLVFVAFGLMLLGKADTILVEKAQTVFHDVTAPILVLLAKPASGVSKFMQNMHEIVAIREENAKLRQENKDLAALKMFVERLSKENSSLVELLNYHLPPKTESISARVIVDTGSSFAQSLVAYIGDNKSVAKGNVVISGDGIVGRIASVGINAARILLITDINSRVPVKIEPAGVPAILAGDNTEYPQLISISDNVDVSVGDKVVTSGMAGVYPMGLPIGVVVSVKNGIIKVNPFFKKSRLEIVRIIDYGLSGLIADVVCETNP